MALLDIFRSSAPKYTKSEQDFLEASNLWVTKAAAANRNLLTMRLHDRAWDRYLGRHWTRSLETPFKNKPAYNHTARVIETILPILTDSRPVMQAQARQPEDEPFARALDAALAYLWEVNDMDMKLVEALKTTLLSGTCYLKVYYDPFENHGKGEVCIGIVPPDLFFYDPDCTTSNLDDARFQYQKVPVDPFAMQSRFEELDFGEYGEDAPGEGKGNFDAPTFGSSVVDYQGASARPFYGNYGDGKNLNTRGGDFYYEFWFRTPKYPDGRVAWVYNGRLLKHKGSDTRIIDNPMPGGVFPFVALVDKVVPGCVMGKSTAQDVVPLHDAFNFSMGQVWEHTRRTSNPIRIIPQDIGLPEAQKKAAEPGSIWEPASAEGSDKLRYLVPPELQQTVLNFVDRTRTAQDEIAGTHDTIQGQRAEATVSGRAQAVLQEAALTRVKLQQRNMENALSKVGQRSLSLMLTYYSEPRIMRTSSQEGGSEFHQIIPKVSFDDEMKPVRYFEVVNAIKVRPETDANGQPINDEYGRASLIADGSTTVSRPNPQLDVRMVTGSSLPVSKAAKFQQLLDLSQSHAEDGLPFVLRKHVLQAINTLLDPQQVLRDIEDFKKSQAPSGPPPVAEKAAINIVTSTKDSDAATAAAFITATKAAIEGQPPPGAPAQGGQPPQPAPPGQ